MRSKLADSIMRSVIKVCVFVTLVNLTYYIVLGVRKDIFNISTVATVNFITFICAIIICDVLLFSCAMDKNKLDKQAFLYILLLLFFPIAVFVSSLLTTSEVLNLGIITYSLISTLETASNVLLSFLMFFYINETQKNGRKSISYQLCVIVPLLVAYFIIVVLSQNGRASDSWRMIPWGVFLLYMSCVIIKNRRGTYETASLLCLVWMGTLCSFIGLIYEGFYPFYLGILMGLLLCFSNVYIKKSDILGDTETDLNLSASIQLDMLPNDFRIDEFDTIDLFASMRPAKEIGGDFYDFYRVDRNHLVFVVADVSGKGAPGAMMMMRAITSIKNLAVAGLSIDKVVEMASETINESNDAMLFVTAWMGKLNLENGELEFINAGHNPPFIRHADGTVSEINSKPDMIMGFYPQVHYRLQKLLLHPGDTLYLYTDGVTEAFSSSDKQYGTERLRNVLSENYDSSKSLCKSVTRSVDTFASGVPQFDDMTMMAIKYIRPNDHLTKDYGII